MAIITPSRHMETPMLAIVRMVRRRLRHEFRRINGRERSMYLPVYAWKRCRVQVVADQLPFWEDRLRFRPAKAGNPPAHRLPRQFPPRRAGVLPDAALSWRHVALSRG